MSPGNIYAIIALLSIFVVGTIIFGYLNRGE